MELTISPTTPSLVHADEADRGVGAGADELPLQLLVALDDLVHADVFKAGEEVVGLDPRMLGDHAGHGIAVTRTERLRPEIRRLDNVGIAGDDEGVTVRSHG